MRRKIGLLLLILSLLLPGFTAVGQQDIDVSLLNFGVRSVYRPGGFVCIRIQLVSKLDENKTIQVVWEVPEGAGDIAEQTKSGIAIGPGQPVDVRLYTKLLPGNRIDNSTVWTVRVYEEDEEGNRGNEIGAARISPNSARAPAQSIPPRAGMIGIIGGSRTAGLGQYNVSLSNRGAPITGHEQTALVAGIAPIDLPDKWEGFDCFEAIVWTDASPGGLTLETGNALREYILRGGHLIIILSPNSNDWNLGSVATTSLHDLLPSQLPSTKVLTLRELIPVLSKRDPLTIPPDSRTNIEVTVRTFEDIGNSYQPLIVLPEPNPLVVAAQRLYGFGRITLVGIELHSGQLSTPSLRIGDKGGEIIEADIVWNRILGRRRHTLLNHQFKALEDAKTLNSMISNRSPYNFSRGNLVIEKIKLAGQAAAGLGLAVLLFAFYWLLAGPVGFGLLKRYKRIKHAWVVFAGTSALFALIAWGGVMFFSLKEVKVRHLSFIDFIARNPDDPRNNEPQYHRVTSWFTIFFPGYGQRTISLDSEDGLRNIITPFSAPGVDQGTFQNVDQYRVDLRSPNSYQVPVRATTKEMYTRWIGPIEADYSRLFTVTEAIGRKGTLITGQITSNFPYSLINVKVIVIEPRPTTPLKYTDKTGATGVVSSRVSSAPFVGSAWKIGQLGPGAVIDLSQLRGGQSLTQDFNKLSKNIENSGNPTIPSRNDFNTFLELLQFFQMAEPPEYSVPANSRVGYDRPIDFNRELFREIDLSAWTGRPCIIVIGQVQKESDAKLPLPLRVNDVATQSEGTTIVRWIYPLTVTAEDLAQKEPE